jgi:hypothetical protein
MTYLRRSVNYTQYKQTYIKKSAAPWRPYGIMQSIFSSASRRYRLERLGRAGRRDGELKMDWTKPLHQRSNYGF